MTMVILGQNGENQLKWVRLLKMVDIMQLVGPKYLKNSDVKFFINGQIGENGEKGEKGKNGENSKMHKSSVLGQHKHTAF